MAPTSSRYPPWAAPAAPYRYEPSKTSSLTAPATIALTAATSGPITQVEFFDGPSLLATVSTAPYTYTWTNVLPGTYSITPKANGTITMAPTAITVSSITLSTSFSAPSTILLTATTTGPVTQVEVFNGATLLATVSTAPYT